MTGEVITINKKLSKKQIILEDRWQRLKLRSRAKSLAILAGSATSQHDKFQAKALEICIIFSPMCYIKRRRKILEARLDQRMINSNLRM